MRLINITGKRFGRLIALQYMGLRNPLKKDDKWECICDCGIKVLVSGAKLRSGHTKSCGCLVADSCRDVGKSCKTHGQSYSTLYSIWQGMKKRCSRIKNSNFIWYGGRGVSICPEWKNFENFFEWNKLLGEKGYKKGLSLDRINNEMGYSPENCRWTTAVTQGRNKRNNLLVTINGETKCVAAWAEIFSINRYLVYSRIRNGWELNEGLFTPPKQKQRSGRS